jgi:hypothetical protein
MPGPSIVVREMTAAEVWCYFSDLGQRGFIAESGADILGWVGLNSDEHGLYAHSMFCRDEGSACAAITQAIVRLCRDLRIQTFRYIVDANNPHLLKFVENGRASVQSYIVVAEVPPAKQVG